MRLIDADALMMPINASWRDAGLHSEDYGKIKRWIKNAPTIEAEPVKHGRWEEKTVSNCRIDEWQSARCSVCGRYHTTPYLYYFTDYKYCPTCGTPMDLEGEKA